MKKGFGLPIADTGKWFVTTHWSIVFEAKKGQTASSEKALESLCQTYWPPIYGFIRRKGYSPAESEDLTQSFFAHLIAREFLGFLEDRRAKFRSFLLAFLKHFLSDQRAKDQALKRGGGQRLISIDAVAAADWERMDPADLRTPEEEYERRFARTVLDQAVSRLRQEFVSQGKVALFEALAEFQPGRHGPVSYADVGARLGMSEEAIKSAVHRMRRRHREILREEIRRTVGHAGEIDEEARHMIRIMGRGS